MRSVNWWMSDHAGVVTDARASGGWIGWMTTNRSPAAAAAMPVERISPGAVIFIVSSVHVHWEKRSRGLVRCPGLRPRQASRTRIR